MKDWLVHFLVPTANLSEGSREWALGSDGLPSGWAFFIFLLLLAWTLWLYGRGAAAGLPRWKRGLLVTLRSAALAVLLALLVKPVLNITLNEPIRQNLLVLVDSTQSMALQDKRDRPEDLKRAALAAGLTAPDAGLRAEPPAKAAAEVGKLSRWELLTRLAANERLDLWPRLAAKSDLVFYRFGREPRPWATFTATADQKLDAGEVARLFRSAPPREPGTAIGESLRQVLRESRGQPVAGVVLITDGANNSGLPPVEAAQIAREEKIPLFCYGVGITSPPDLVFEELNAPRLAFVKERAEVRARIRQEGFAGRTVTATLKANGKTVDEQPVKLSEEGECELTFGFVPEEMGELKLEASVPVLPGEIASNNNAASARLRVIDSKVHVLYIEQEPRWEYRYLLSYLQRDRRLDLRCCLIDGEPGLDKIKDSPFLPRLPEDREAFFKAEILILGDVDPAALGETRMKIIREWVEQAGGSVIFLAGPKFSPGAYAGTPLEALLPVVPDPSRPAAETAQRSPDFFPLKRSALGESSPYLKMAGDPAENGKIWDGFHGVRWTAPVTAAKPGAHVLLIDSRPERATQAGPLPVLALQEYGSGACVYVGTDETYRWRSRKGELYYSRFWSQIMESLSLQRLQGASSLTQLKSDRPVYYVGDKVVLAGKIYKEGFEPMSVPAIEGVLKSDQPGDKGTPLPLAAVPGLKGEYRAEFSARTPGSYRFSTLQDPNAGVKFEIQEANFETLRAAMDAPLLEAMARTAQGQFLREEDLARLPELVASQSATASSFQKIDLYHSPWWIAALALLFAGEWLIRRLSQLK